jgi:haloalkane dehalogenase
MQLSYFATSHGRLHLRSNDRRDLPALLLLHQSPSDARMYEALMAELENEFWVLAPDNPGFGCSAPLPNGFDIAGCAAVIDELLQGLGIDSCYLFGHHTGASIAVQLAHDQPERVKKLALSGPPLLDDALRSALPDSARPFPITADGAHLQGMWDRMSAKEGDTPASIIQREVMAAFTAGDSYPQAYAAVIEQDFSGQLATLECSTLVFAGTGDVLYHRLRPAHELLQRGLMHEIEGAGGYVCDRQPAVVAELLRDFFREQ